MKPCRCERYKFPHRHTRGCDEFAREQSDQNEPTQEEINAEMLALFDRAEARAINQERMK